MGNDSENGGYGALDLELAEVIGELAQRVDTVERIVKSMEPGPLYQNDLDTLHREYHTLKSEAAILDLPEFSDFSRNIESSLAPYREDVVFLEDETIAAFGKIVEISRAFLLSAGKKVSEQLVSASETGIKVLTALLKGENSPVPVSSIQIPTSGTSATGTEALPKEQEAQPIIEEAPATEQKLPEREEPSFFALDDEEESATQQVPAVREEPSFFALDDDEEAPAKGKQAPEKTTTSFETISEAIAFLKNVKEGEISEQNYAAIEKLLEQFKADLGKADKKDVSELYALRTVFLTKGRDKDYTNFAAFHEHFVLLLETIENTVRKLHDKKAVNIKSKLSKLKLFLGLFDYIQEETQEQQSEDPSEWVDEIMKRIESIEQIVLAMEEGPLGSDEINTIFREFHTMKSEAALLELMNVSAFSHKVESALMPLRESDFMLTVEMIEAFMEIVEYAKFILSLGKNQPTETELEHIYEPINKLVTIIADQTAETYEENDKGAEGRTEDAAEGDEQGSSLETNFKKELADIVDSKKKSSAIEVKIDRLDKLINLAGEISTIFHLINQSETIRNLNNQSLLNDLNLLGRMCKDLQASSMTMRMVSIMPLFHKLNRVVRNIAKEERKKVVVELVGTDLEIDKNVVDTVSEALVHMMRNSVDHGVESPRERIDAGKRETAVIQLIITKKEDHVIFRIHDDGRGIDEEKIKEAIVSKGLLTKEQARELSRKDVFSYIFKPGFSTAKKITAVSGRGVGMDVVLNAVNELGGVVEVDSETGHWTEVTISIPSSYTQIETLLVRAGETFFILPVTMVKEMLDFGTVEINSINKKSSVIKVRGELLPLLFLNEIMDCTYDNISQRAIVVVEYRRRKCALVFDEVLNTQEVVLKKLEGPVSNLEYISGSGILGNRKIGLLLNIQKVLDRISKEFKDLEHLHVSHEKDGTSNKIETVSIGTNKVAMIDFYIDWKKESGEKERTLFAMNAFKTLEFVTKKRIVSVPNSPDSFEGVMQIRDETLPILNLAKMLGLNLYGAESELVIVCEFNQKRLGISVTGVNKVNYVSWNDILPPPKTNNLIKNHYVVGNIIEGEKITMVLDFERLLSEVMHFYDDLHLGQNSMEATDKKVKLLVVEDSSLVRRKFSNSLRNANYEVLEAENGKEALDLINKLYDEARLSHHSILDYLDAVITDIEMPLMDGYSLTRSIKEHPEIRVLPVVLHSSISNETMIRRSKEVHADGFINKCDTKGLNEFLQNNL